MEQKYVYRVMNVSEEASGYIISKEFFDYSPWLAIPRYQLYLGKDALDYIAGHLTKGNNNNVHTPWISCSKDFDILLNFATEQEDRRPSLAIIENHSKTALDSEKFKKYLNQLYKNEITLQEFRARARHMHLGEIKKMVLDFSVDRDEIYKQLIQLGLVNKRNGEVRYKEFTREINYAKANKELLVLGEVPESDVTILSPLQYDILYALLNNGSIKEINKDIIDKLYNDLRISYSYRFKLTVEESLHNNMKEFYDNLNDIEKFVFTKLYIERIPLTSFCKDYNNKKYALEIQKQILNKIIKFINEKRLISLNPNNIRTLEDDKVLKKVI